METYFLLTEAVQISLISALGGIIIVILGFIFPILTKIFNKQIEIRDGQIQTHKEMDGMKDELVRTTAELSRVKGIMEGRAEMKQELKEININLPAVGQASQASQTEANRQDIEKLKTDASAAPVQVVVTNPEPLPVIVKK